MSRAMTSTVEGRGRTVAAAATAAVDHLRRTQDPAGWWKGELATNVTIDAEDLLLREFLGIRGARETEEAARWIRSRQRDDGTWATFHGGPPDLSTTVEAWVALRLAGYPPDVPPMAKAAAYVRAHGGIAQARVFTRIWLALSGLWPWDELPELPPEMILLPRWFPLNIYDWACWARQTVVPLTIVSALRPVRPLPFDVNELRVDVPCVDVSCVDVSPVDELRVDVSGVEVPRTGAEPPPSPPPPSPPPIRTWSWTSAGAFARLDRLLRRYGRHPVGWLRRLAMRRAAAWILARQEADGSWGGIQPPWVYSLLALHLLGYPLDHPALAAGLSGLAGFTIRERTPDGPVRRLEACQSPVWDTALAVTALLDAGVPAHDPGLVRAAEWLLGQEVRVRGDWAVRRPRLAPGGWAFEFANENYPDVDDTAEVVLALRRVAHPDAERLRAAIDRGVAWTVGMRSRDGGWAAFDADNTRTLPARLPFCDFGAVTDPPTADVTAHVVEMLAAQGRAGDPVCRAGVAWLLAEQEADGSWFGRWGANHVYGTGAAVVALVAAAAGTHPGAEPVGGAECRAGCQAGCQAECQAECQAVGRALRWLCAHQNPDGGWGEDPRSYRDPAWRGRGTSTASQTAWALLALLAVGRPAREGEHGHTVLGDGVDKPVGRPARGVESDYAGAESEFATAVERGVAHLVYRQRGDGTWDEPEFTGTGFPGDFYINYHIYRHVFPLSALGRYLAQSGGRS